MSTVDLATPTLPGMSLGDLVADVVAQPEEPEEVSQPQVFFRSSFNTMVHGVSGSFRCYPIPQYAVLCLQEVLA